MDTFPSSSFTNVTAISGFSQVSWHCLSGGEGEEILSKCLTIQTQLLQQGILATVQFSTAKSDASSSSSTSTMPSSSTTSNPSNIANAATSSSSSSSSSSAMMMMESEGQDEATNHLFHPSSSSSAFVTSPSPPSIPLIPSSSKGIEEPGTGGSGGVELWVFQSPASPDLALPQTALSLLVEFEVKGTGTCVVEQEAQVSLFLQAVNHLVARQLMTNGLFRFGNSFLLPKGPDFPSISCKITPQWSGSSLLFLTFVEQIKLRQIKLRDLTTKASKDIPYFLCPTGERVRVLRNQSSLPTSQRIFDEWVFYFGFEREFLESNLEFGMPQTVTCLLRDKQIEVPSKCLFTFTHWNPCEPSSPANDLFRQFWLNNFVFLQNITGDHSASVSLTQPCRSILASSIPDPLTPLPLDGVPRDGIAGEKPKGSGLVTKKTILEFSSKFQPKVPADVITPQQDPTQNHPLSATYTNKVSTLDMKLEDLDSNLDEFNIENELSEFFSDSRAGADKSSLSLTSPQVDPPSQTPQADFTSGTPSSHFQSMHSPQFEQSSLPPPLSVPSTLTPSAQITFTPGAVSSPIFSPAQLQATSVPPSQVQDPSPSSFANTPPSSSGAPLPSEKYIRPTIYSPLNITFGNLAPRFSPLKAGTAAAGTSQAKSGPKPATPITPGSEGQLSGDDDDSDSDFEEEEEHHNRGGEFPVNELCFGIDALVDDAPLQQGYEAYLRDLELLPAASATSPVAPQSSVNSDLSEDFLAALKIHVGGLFSGCLPASIDPSLLGPEDEPHFPPIRIPVPQEGAFRVLFMLQNLYGATFGDPRKGTRGLLTLLQYAELLDLDCTSSQYEKNPLFRRKRKTESKVEPLPYPDVVVGQDDSWLKVSSRVLNLWEKASFLPYSPQKDFRYFVVVPKNPYLINLVGSFFRDLSSIFDNCQLGSHKPGGLTQTSQKNMFPISLDSVAVQAKEDRFKELSRLYTDVAHILGRTLQAIESTIPADTFVVIYFISPLLGEDCSLLLCEAFSKLLTSVASSRIRSQLIFQGVSLEHLVGYPAHGPSNSSNLRDLAFSVYTKARPLLRRSDNPFLTQRPGPMKKEDYSLFAPPVILFRTSSPKVRYNVVSQPAPFGWEKLLHVCYNFSSDRRWVAVSWTDDRGELLEIDLINSSEQGSDRSLFSKIWRQTSNMARVTSFPWRVVLCKVGVLTSSEHEDWMAVLQDCTEHLKGSWQTSAQTPSPTYSTQVGEYDNINSVSLCWLAPFTSLQVFEPFFSPSKGPSSKDLPSMVANSPQAAPAPRVLVSTQRVSFTQGAAPTLSNGLLCESSIGSQPEALPWPRAMEVSLVFHQAGFVTTASNSSFRTWGAEGVTMDSILRDICLQLHALSFLGLLSPTGRGTDLLPFHARVTSRMLKMVSNSGLHPPTNNTTTRSATSLTPAASASASASTPSFPPSSFPMYYE